MSVPSKVSAAMVAFRCRSANVMSWVLVIACAASGDDTTSVGTSPRRSIMSGPYLCERPRIAR
jgi:hypothetical protein